MTRPWNGIKMDEHMEWAAGQQSCWGLTVRVLAGFGGVLAVAWMAGIVDASQAEVVATLVN